jgi:hypothetical protein
MLQDGLQPPEAAACQTKTAQAGAANDRSRWSRRDILASAEQYDLSAVLDGRMVDVCGIGSVLTEPSRWASVTRASCRNCSALLHDREPRWTSLPRAAATTWRTGSSRSFH